MCLAVLSSQLLQQRLKSACYCHSVLRMLRLCARTYTCTCLHHRMMAMGWTRPGAPKHFGDALAYSPELETVVRPFESQLERYIEDRLACGEPQHQVCADALPNIEFRHFRVKLRPGEKFPSEVQVRVPAKAQQSATR